MPWELFILFFVIPTIFSQIAMINYAISKDKDQSMASFLFFYNFFRIIEYVEITKRENGKIGKWFWVFIFSLLGLIGSAVAEIFNLGLTSG